MKKIISLVLVVITTIILLSCGKSKTISINGAGATFPYPVYLQWTNKYPLDKPDVQINYQATGSGAGISQIKAGVIDFGGTDEPLKKDELIKSNLIQFPVVMSGVVLIYNIEGINNLKLTPDIISDIFLKKITNWNNKRIQDINEEKLPNLNINVVHRADGSGTTWLFTNYLSDVSSEWKTNVGCAKSLNWPTGIGGKGNLGVATYVQQLKGTIGYTEYSYAVENKINMSSIQNKDGNFVEPMIENFKSAIQDIQWNPNEGFYQILTNKPGKDTWPIVGVSYILIRKDCDAVKAKEIINFFVWSLTKGADTAENLGYVVPTQLKDEILKLSSDNFKN
jgi:phosphate transport system substrate-binding protein